MGVGFRQCARVTHTKRYSNCRSPSHNLLENAWVMIPTRPSKSWALPRGPPSIGVGVVGGLEANTLIGDEKGILALEKNMTGGGTWFFWNDEKKFFNDKN